MADTTITQLVLDGNIVMPEVSYDRYSCWEDEKRVDLEMADWSMVRQVPEKNKVWRARYAFDVLDTDTRNRALEVLQRGEKFKAQMLPSNGGTELVTAEVYCVALVPPSFAFSDAGEPVWHNMSFELREVAPHA